MLNNYNIEYVILDPHNKWNLVLKFWNFDIFDWTKDRLEISFLQMHETPHNREDLAVQYEALL